MPASYNAVLPRLLAVLAAVSLVGLPARPQDSRQKVDPRQPPQAPAPPEQGKGAIRAFADLVLVDVQVTDRSDRKSVV